MPRPTITEIKEKIIKFCLYQERSPWETQQKLLALGCDYSLSQEILTELILENYVNEERFCYEYAYGKFTLKKWGRLKIRQGLQEHHASPRNIENALQKAIDPKLYESILLELLQKKWQSLPSTLSNYEKKIKLSHYAAQKGFEWELISEAIQNFFSQN
ncbi:MAG: regulatory protein RecX [Bacteroidia bacterium]|nr:RecX family transcriptional regulator [Bacteroidia bacterium]MDW8158029.1 regulatory protein RecX [Bacteroidia bacterium]